MVSRAAPSADGEAEEGLAHARADRPGAEDVHQLDVAVFDEVRDSIDLLAGLLTDHGA